MKILKSIKDRFGFGGGPKSPTYAVTPTSTSITEGNTVTFNVATTNVPSGTTLYWTNAGTADGTDFSGGANNGSFTITSNAGSVSITTLNNATYEGTETIIFQVRTGSTSGPIVATAATVNLADAAPTYSVTPTTTSITEGSSVTFNVTTTNIPNGTTLYWTNSGTTTGADFSGGANSGSFTVTSNAGSVSRTTINSFVLSGTKTIIFRVRTGSTSGPIVATAATVNVADAAPTYSVTPTTTSISEGGSVQFIVSVTNVADFTTLYWTNSGTTDATDFSSGVNSGSFSVAYDGFTPPLQGAVTLTTVNNAAFEGTETIIFNVRTGSTAGPIVATATTVNVADAAPTYSVSPSSTNVTESGTSTTWTITTTNIANGTTLYFTLSGTISVFDTSYGSNTGSLTINNNTGSFSMSFITQDTLEGTETCIFELRTGSTAGPIVATAATVNVSDAAASYSISPSVSSVNEGGTVTWGVTAYNAPSTLYWTNGGTTVGADFTDSANSGSFTLSGTSGSISRTLTNDATSEGSETIIMQVRTGSTAGPIVATSSTVTVNDTSVPTASVSPSTNNVNEGSSVTWTVTTTGYANGTYFWTNGGTTSAADFSIGVNSGSFTLTSGSGSISLTLNNDVSTGEGSETIIMQIRTGSTAGPIIATSSTVTVNDTSFLPPPVTITWSATGGGGDSHLTVAAGAGAAGVVATGTTTLNWQQSWSFQAGQIGPPFATTQTKLCSHGCPSFVPNGTGPGGGGAAGPATGVTPAWGGPFFTGGSDCRFTISPPFAIQVQTGAGYATNCPQQHYGGGPGGASMVVWCGTRTPQSAPINSPNILRGASGGGGGRFWGGNAAYQTIGQGNNPLGDRVHAGPGGSTVGYDFWYYPWAFGGRGMGSGGGVGGIGGGAGDKGDVGQGGNGAYCGTIVASGQNGAGVSGGAGGGLTPAGPGAGNRNRGGVGYLDFQMPGKVCITAGSATPLFFGGYYTCGGGGTLTYCVP